MSPKRRIATRTPLDVDALNRLALHYVGRYATTRARLIDYLKRKVMHRGWSDDSTPPLEAIADRCVASGYVDDAAFAAARSGTLSRRGYGSRRIGLALSQAGVDGQITRDLSHDEEAAFEAARAFAKRKRLGAYAASLADEDVKRRAFAAMLRAGHSFDLARRFTTALPGAEPTLE